jgi:hypothetical protein
MVVVMAGRVTLLVVAQGDTLVMVVQVRFQIVVRLAKVVVVEVALLTLVAVVVNMDQAVG